MVVRYSSGGLSSPGKLDAWIDGQIPRSPDAWFSRKDTPTPSWPWQLTNLKPAGYFAQWGGPGGGVWPSLRMLPSAFDGGIDEVALYETALPDALIVQHYADAMSHKPYSPSVRSTLNGAADAPPAVAPPVDPAPSFDMKEYPPGTLLPTPKASGCGTPHCTEMPTPGVKLSPLAQLQSFPLPRYHSPPTGKFVLQRLGNCMDASYLGGENNGWNGSMVNMPCYISCNKTTHRCNGTESDCVTNATIKIQHELGMRWNYLAALGNVGCSNTSDPTCGWAKPRPSSALHPPAVSPIMATIDMVNANPEMGFEYYLTRANNRDLQIGNLNGGADSNCNGNQSLPDSCYMQNASGHFIGPRGDGANCTSCPLKCKQPRLLVSDAARAKYCPDSLFTIDFYPKSWHRKLRGLIAQLLGNKTRVHVVFLIHRRARLLERRVGAARSLALFLARTKPDGTLSPQPKLGTSARRNLRAQIYCNSYFP